MDQHVKLFYFLFFDQTYFDFGHSKWTILSIQAQIETVPISSV